MYDNHTMVKLLMRPHNSDYTEVFAVIGSVSGDEILRAIQLGYKSKYKLEVNAMEYHDEPYVELDGIVYSVYRIYGPVNDKVEIYVEEKLGV